MKLTIDQIFPRKRKRDFSDNGKYGDGKVYKVPGYNDNENMWEFLCQIGLIKMPINMKTPLSLINKVQAKTQVSTAGTGATDSSDGIIK